MKKYCVAYSWSNGAAMGFGNIDCTIERKDMDAIKSIQKELSKKVIFPNSTIIILNLIELDEDEETPIKEE